MSTIINKEPEISPKTQNSIQLGGVFEDLKHQSNASSMPFGVEGEDTERSLTNVENDSSASTNVKYKDTNVNIERVGDQYMETDSYVCNSMEDAQLDSCVPNKNSSSAGLLSTSLENKVKDNALFDNNSDLSQKSLTENDNVLNNKQTTLEDGQSSNFVNDHHQNDLDFSSLEQSMEVSYEKPEKVDQNLDITNLSEKIFKNSDAIAGSEQDHSINVESKVEFVDNKFVSDASAQVDDEWQMEDYEEGDDGQWEDNGELEEGETELLDEVEDGLVKEVGRLDVETGQSEVEEADHLEGDEAGQLEGDVAGQLEGDEADELKDGETGHMEGDESDQLEHSETGHMEGVKSKRLQEDEIEAPPLEGVSAQLAEDKGQQSEEGESIQIEAYHVDEAETHELEESKGEQLVKSKDEKEPNLIDDSSSSQLCEKMVQESTSDELENEKSHKLEKKDTDSLVIVNTEEEAVTEKTYKDDITQQQMEIKDVVKSESENAAEQVTKEDNGNSTTPNVQNKESDVGSIENVESIENVDDDADVDDILDKISKEDALEKSGIISDKHVKEENCPQDVEMSENISKNEEVVIEDSDDDDFDPISLLAVEHSTPDEPMDSEFSKKIGLCNSDDSRPSSIGKFSEVNIDQDVDSPSGSSLPKSDESADEESQDSVDLKEVNGDIEKIVMKTLEEIINKTVCIVDNIPEHFFYSSNKRKKLGFVQEGTVEEVVDEIVSKVSVASKKLAKEVAKAAKTNETKSIKKEDSNQNNLDNQKGFKNCTECGSNKGLKYQVLFHGRTCFLCSDHCFKIFRSKQNLAPPPPGLTRPTETCSVCRVEIKNGQGYFP